MSEPTSWLAARVLLMLFASLAAFTIEVAR